MTSCTYWQYGIYSHISENVSLVIIDPKSTKLLYEKLIIVLQSNTTGSPAQKMKYFDSLTIHKVITGSKELERKTW